MKYGSGCTSGLRVHAVFAEDQRSIPSIPTEQLPTTWWKLQFQGIWHPLWASVCTSCLYRLAGRHSHVHRVFTNRFAAEHWCHLWFCFSSAVKRWVFIIKLSFGFIKIALVLYWKAIIYMSVFLFPDATFCSTNKDIKICSFELWVWKQWKQTHTVVFTKPSLAL